MGFRQFLRVQSVISNEDMFNFESIFFFAQVINFIVPESNDW